VIHLKKIISLILLLLLSISISACDKEPSKHYTHYTLSYNSNGGTTIPDITVEYNAEISMPTNPIKTGHTFVKWYTDSDLTVEFTFDKMPKEDITLHAKWTVNRYTITFNSNDGQEVTAITENYGTNITKPTDPIKIGHTFVGWYRNNNLTTGYTFKTMLAENITLYAKWSINQSTISFESNEGSMVTPITRDYHEAISKPLDPTKVGYTFEGWYHDSNLTTKYSFTTMPAEDLLLYAKWSINEYMITFNSDGGSIVPPIIENYKATITQPSDPTRANYTFIGWYIGYTTLYTFETMPPYDITLYAKWEINEYTITFNSNGGSEIPPITRDFQSIVNPPVNPTKIGYTFAGWYCDIDLSTLYTFTTMPSEGLILYAKWTLNPYTISFVSNGGTDVESITQDFNSTVLAPPIPTKVGHTFIGWYANSDLSTIYTFDKMPSYSIILYAKWEIKENTLVFNSNGGSEIPAVTQDFQTIVNPPENPTKIGYTFSGWYDDINFTTEYIITTMPAESLTLYAKWTNNSYMISFVSNGGTDVEPITQDFNTELSTPADPIKVGYTFIGWYRDIHLTTLYQFTTMPPEDVTLYAKWMINSYTMSFNSIGGTAIESITQNYNTDVSVPNNPIKIGYTFAGWYRDIETTNLYTIMIMPAEDLILYAKWTINLYTITFIPNGDTDVISITQSYNTVVNQPTDPEKVGYSFAGWYRDFDLVTLYIFTTMKAEDITLYAKWTINSYTITFDSNGGTDLDSITQDYLTDISDPTNPTKVGYTFDGWYYDRDLVSLYTLTTMPAEDIILYAKWKVNQYTITFNSNEGTEVLSITEDYDTILSKPIDPTKTEYTFSGWFIDSEYETEYIFTTMPAVNMTLYAKWLFGSIEGLTYVNLGDGSCSVSGYNDNNEYVVIPQYYDGCLINKIEEKAFEGSNLISIVIPSSVTMIEMDAFKGATYLTTVTFDGNSQLTVIDWFAFYGASSLTNLTLPNLVSTIGYGAFSYTTSLTEITIPNRVTKIENSAFSHSGLTTILFEEGSQLTSIGTIFKGSNLTSIVIPNNVTTIGAMAFADVSSLTNIVFEEGSQLTTIGSFAFSGATGLTSITIPKSVTKLNSNTFSGTTNLSTIIFEEDTQLNTIEDEAFKDATGLTSIIIPNNVTMIGSCAFQGTTSLTTIVFEAGSQLTTIEGNTFYEAISLSEVLFEEDSQLTIIEENAFKDLNLTSINLPSQLTTIGNHAFENTSLISILIPNSVITIGGYTFAETSSLLSVIFEEGSQLTTIGDNAFTRATSIANLTIPKGVETIGDGAFYGTISLSTVLFEEGTRLTTIGSYLFSTSGITNIIIPRGVTIIGNGAFYGATNLLSIEFEEGSQLTVIGENAFYGATSLTCITIPNRVIAMGPNVFSRATSLSTVIFEEGSELTYISTGAFNQTNLSYINIPNSVTSIKEWAFSYSNITRIIIPNSVYRLEKGAFYGATKLETVIFEEDSHLGRIEDQVFHGATNLKTIVLPNSLFHIGISVFAQTTNLTSITIPNSVWYMGSFTFQDSGIETISFEEGSQLRTINSSMFAGSSLTNITIPSSISTLSGAAFYGTTNLTSIIIPNSVTSLGASVFMNSGLESIIFEESSTITTIHNHAFDGTINLTNITIPSSVSTIGTYVFENSGVEIIIMERLTPPTLYSFFVLEIPINLKIYVPAASLDLYKTQYLSYSPYIFSIDDLI